MQPEKKPAVLSSACHLTFLHAGVGPRFEVSGHHEPHSNNVRLHTAAMMALGMGAALADAAARPVRNLYRVASERMHLPKGWGRGDQVQKPRSSSSAEPLTSLAESRPGGHDATDGKHQ